MDRLLQLWEEDSPKSLILKVFIIIIVFVLGALFTNLEKQTYPW